LTVPTPSDLLLFKAFLASGNKISYTELYLKAEWNIICRIQCLAKNCSTSQTERTGASVHWISTFAVVYIELHHGHALMLVNVIEHNNFLILSDNKLFLTESGMLITNKKMQYA
jgi:hypothetical protein